MYLLYFRGLLVRWKMRSTISCESFLHKSCLEMVQPPITELHCGVEGRLELEGGKFESLFTDELHAISVLLSKKFPIQPTHVILPGIERFGKHLAKIKLPCH